MYKDIPKIENTKYFNLTFVVASKTQPPKTDKADEKDYNFMYTFMYTFKWENAK